MLSESEYNEIMKARRNADYLAMIDKSMEEARQVDLLRRALRNWRLTSK